MINLKEILLVAAAAASIPSYIGDNYAIPVSAGASTIYPSFFYFLSGSKFRVDGRTLFYKYRCPHNRMKRIGGSRSYRRLSIEALKKKGAVCCVCKGEWTPYKNIYLSSLFLCVE